MVAFCAGRLRHVQVRSFVPHFTIILLLSIAAWAGDTEAVLYRFKGGVYGSDSYGAVAMDATGNLYGTTYDGGTYAGSCVNFGCGTVFKLAPGSGGWEMSPVHRFTGAEDGSNPQAGLFIDSAGNLYGTASAGGAYGHGTVFKLNQVSDGGWKITVLHAFKGGSDGEQPEGPLTMDAEGNLYGTTVLGGQLLRVWNGVRDIAHSSGRLEGERAIRILQYRQRLPRIWRRYLGQGRQCLRHDSWRNIWAGQRLRVDAEPDWPLDGDSAL